MDSTFSPSTALRVTCLCAQWCGTCRDYQSIFESLKLEFPQLAFEWIDVEDQADLVDPIEVENFPTLLIAQSGKARFFGTITPHVETIRRLIQAHLTDGGVASYPAEVNALAQRLTAQAS